MSFRGSIGRLRYNYAVSRLLIIIFKPIYSISLGFARFISEKIKVNGFTCQYKNIEIIFPKNVGVGINSKLFWKGINGFEPLTSKTLFHLFYQVEVFLDVGSNFGFYSVLAKKVNPNIKVLCFEPLPNIYIDNILFHKANGLSNQLTYNVALSNKKGESQFFVPNVYNVQSEVTSASIERDFAYNKRFQQSQISIHTTTLDDILDLHKVLLIGNKTLIKIDVEGHELSVLRGGDRFITELRPYIVIEIDKNRDNVDNLWSIFEEKSYGIFAITTNGFFRLSQTALQNFKDGSDFLLIPSYKTDYFSFESIANLLSER